MKNPYDQLVAGLESIANDAAGIEAFDRLDHFEERINAEVEKFKRLDILSAGIEDSNRICLREVRELENTFPGMMYSTAMMDAQFTIAPSQSGVTAALEAIDWKKAGKWGLIGAIIAAIIAIIAKIIGSRGKDAGVAAQAEAVTESLGKTKETHAHTEKKTEESAKAASNAAPSPQDLREFDDLVRGQKAGSFTSTKDETPQRPHEDSVKSEPGALGHKPRVARPSKSSDNKTSRDPIPMGYTGPAKTAPATKSLQKVKLDRAVRAFTSLSNHLKNGSSYDFSNTEVSKKWTGDEVRRMPSLLPAVRSAQAWASVRSSFLWSTDHADIQAISEVFKELAQSTTPDPKEMEQLKTLTSLTIELRTAGDLLMSAIHSGQDHKISGETGNVSVIVAKINPILANIKQTGNVDQHTAKLNEKIAHAIALIKPTSAEAKSISDSRSKLFAPTVNETMLQPILASVQLIKKNGNEVIPMFSSVKTELERIQNQSQWDFRSFSRESSDSDEVKRKKTEWLKTFSGVNTTFNNAVNAINAQYHGMYASFGRTGKALTAYVSAVHSTEQLLKQDTALMLAHGQFLQAWIGISR